MMSRIITMMFYQTALGSSPRVWGQVNGNRSSSCICRIIPTRVGTREDLKMNQPKIKVHPHACGDKQLRFWHWLKGVGSSPRVWGQDTPRIERTGSHGIIPTRVGTSLSCAPALLCLRDHPHACGDKNVSKSPPSTR